MRRDELDPVGIGAAVGERGGVGMRAIRSGHSREHPLREAARDSALHTAAVKRVAPRQMPGLALKRPDRPGRKPVEAGQAGAVIDNADLTLPRVRHDEDFRDPDRLPERQPGAGTDIKEPHKPPRLSIHPRSASPRNLQQALTSTIDGNSARGRQITPPSESSPASSRRRLKSGMVTRRLPSSWITPSRFSAVICRLTVSSVSPR